MILKRLVSVLTLFLVLLAATQAARAQSTSNTVETKDYVLALPSSKWRQETEGVIRDRTYFLYEDEEPIELHIRKTLVDSGVTGIDLITQRQQWERVSTRGYVKTRTERFEGELDGAKYAYEFVKEGRVIGKLIYYLQADIRTIYRLEFTGSPAKLSELGDEMEFIAQSFRAIGDP